MNRCFLDLILLVFGVLCLVVCSTVQKRSGTTGGNPVRNREDDEGTGASLIHGRLGELELISVGKRRVKRDLTHVCKYLKGAHKETGTRLFLVLHSGRTSQWAQSETWVVTYERRERPLL